MKVTLVYPPNRNIPSSPYGALPLLAGCLGARGHTVEIVDANLLAFERMLEPDALATAKATFEARWSELRSRTDLSGDEAAQLQALARLAVVPIDRLMDAGRAGEILRTRELFDDPSNVNWAYDTIANALRALYSINPLPFLLKPSGLDELFGWLEQPNDNPVRRAVTEVALQPILDTEPDLVGVCIPFNEQLYEGFSLMQQLKERRPDLKIIAGGAIISAYAETLCADERFYQYADWGMPGEADEAFPEFCDTLEAGGDLTQVPNLWKRLDSGEVQGPLSKSLPNLNELPAPDFSSVPVGRYFLPETIANYQTSRGCYYGKCTFCSFDIKQNFRFRKAELVQSDIEHIQAQTGLKHFIFWDPLTPPKLMKAISRWNAERGDQKIYWGAETKFEKIFTQQEFTDLLYDGGARFLQFGFESGSQRVLDLMVKGNDLSRVDLMLEAMRQSKIAVSVQWFIGFPGETEEEARASYAYLDDHRDAVLMSSYMGTFTISPDDDIFESSGDLYEIDITQDEGGHYDFHHRDGSTHYDRSELNAAYLSRGDAENITRMAFYLYLTDQPDRVREVSNFERCGPLPDSWEDLAGTQPRFPEWNHHASYDFDIFTPPSELGLDEQPGVLPSTESHGIFVTNTQLLYPGSASDIEMLKRADGTRSPEEIVDGLEGDLEERKRRLVELVRVGVLVVPHQPAPALA